MIYLAGPMTGIEDHNFPAFRAAAKALRENGYRILSPHEESPLVDPEHPMPWSYYMQRDLIALLTRCEAIALLPGWEASRGARLELGIAEAVGYLIYDVVEGRLVARPTPPEWLVGSAGAVALDGSSPVASPDDALIEGGVR